MTNTTGAGIFIEPERGRSYDMGRIAAIFKADGEETANQCSVSEWWIEPNTKGFGAHSHEAEIELFYVLEGTMSFLVGQQWRDAKKGTVILIPPASSTTLKTVAINAPAFSTFTLADHLR
ncbi:cupin domain-containing protein [Microbulbifer sp. MLAF003]|uniref:cupin domain-containing protein n=1 Tax=Microbulbifer sp. MLAF003 TaxID=3032582 RepID=UPI0024AC8C26|nr:cupin domain-containing protein [Microbulbifer sp. MLAF003]WHI53371.1 cupin domain-containing protein [Microbulbifer sp. MLAF003]